MQMIQLLDYARALHRLGGEEVNFLPARFTQSGDPLYFAYLSNDGSYIIIEQNTGAGTIKYYTAQGNFTTDWAGRAALTYVEFNALY